MTVLPLQTTRRCCSDLVLDRLLNEELGANEAAVLQAHLEGAPACRARFEALRADRDAFRAGLRRRETTSTSTSSSSSSSSSSSPTSPSSSSPFRAGRRLPFSGLVAGSVLAASVALVAVAPTGEGGGQGPMGPEVVRPKGGSGIGIAIALDVRRGDREFRLGVAEGIRDGDVVAVALEASAGALHRFVTARIADSDGAVDIVSSPVEVPRDGRAPLGEAVTLDAGGGAVTVTVVACVDDAAARRVPVPLGDGCVLVERTVAREAP